MKLDNPHLSVYVLSSNELENAKSAKNISSLALGAVALGCLIYYVWNAYFLLTDPGIEARSADISEAMPHSWYFILLLVLMGAYVVNIKSVKKASPISEDDLRDFHVTLENGLEDSDTHEQVLRFFEELRNLDRLPVYGDMDHLHQYYVAMQVKKQYEKSQKTHQENRASEAWSRIKDDIVQKFD